MATLAGAIALSSCDRPPAEPEPPTWASAIAPLVHSQCSECHHDGGTAPFALVTYEDVRKRSRQIAEVVASGYMPPWLPVEGFGHFVGERRLTGDEVAMIGAWVEAGSPEGAPDQAPDPPEFLDGWALGEPDLIVEVTDPFPLPAAGHDIYQNLVIPDVTGSDRFIRAIEFDPGDTQAIHHAFVLVDTSNSSRDRAAAAEGPGFPGMDSGTGAQSPDGHFISWQPGKVPHEAPDGLSWRLPKGADLVLQLHMRTTGKREMIQPKVAFYFSDGPPTRRATKLVLATQDIDIPAGAADHVVTDTYRTPVAIEILGTVPHAHYLGRKLHAYATLPDGEIRWIIRIDDWDFDWQGDYQFRAPLLIPAGSMITQSFSFDNSADNPANPNDPPRRVRYGLNSTDEMAELWLQVVTPDPRDLPKLQADFATHMRSRHRQKMEAELAAGTLIPRKKIDLARIWITADKPREASELLGQAARALPGSAEPPYLMGMIHARSGNLDGAKRMFLRATTVDGGHAAAHNGLGNLALQEGKPDDALAHYRSAAQADPGEPTAHANLGRTLMRLGRPSEAIRPLERSLELRPGHPATENLLRQAYGQP